MNNCSPSGRVSISPRRVGILAMPRNSKDAIGISSSCVRAVPVVVRGDLNLEEEEKPMQEDKG